jgi:hypothetical protein
MTVYFYSGVVMNDNRQVGDFHGAVDVNRRLQTARAATDLITEIREGVKSNMIESGEWKNVYQVVLKTLNLL